MKKLILFLTLLFIGLGATFEANAQHSPSNNLNYIKLLKTPPIGSVEDSVMVYDSSSSFVKMLPKSSIVAGYELKSNKQNSLAIDGTGTKYPTVDAVFDALATKAPISSVHNPVTLGTANGLSLATQQLSLGLASSGVTGALSGTDWNTFNNKVNGTGTNNFLTKWSGTNTVNASGAWRETSNRLANAADNGSSEFQVTGQIDLKSKNTQGDGGQLGAELLTTGTGDASWTGTSFATGYTHSTGSVTTLTSALAPVINNLYQVSYTVTGRTSGSFTIVFGGTTTAGIISSSAVGHKASTTGTLVITPTSDFNGTIVLSIKQITAGTASFVFRDNGGTIRNELRILGNGNTANGVGSLLNNTTGSNNTANGLNALLNNTTGNNNTANGVAALLNNTPGNNNTANGTGALLNNTTGSNNTANGVSAGRFIANGTTSLTLVNNGTFLGTDTKALADNSTNETVVGYNAIGNGNNTVSIGNTSVVSSRLRGRLLQGNVVDNLIDSGQFSGNVLATGFKTASGTASQFLKANGSVDSNTYLTSASLPTVDQTIIDGSTNAVSGNAVFDGLVLKAPLASPSLTGTPTAPTATAGTNTTQVATTAFVAGGLATKENAFTKNTAFNKNFGTTAGTVVEGGTLGSNAYNSTAYLPLTGGTINANNETINYKVSSNNGALYNSWYDFNNNRISFLGFGGGTQSNATFFVASENGGNIALTTTGVGKVVVQSLSGTGTRTVVADASGILSAPDIPTAPTAPAGTNTTQVATTAFVLANSSARPYKVYTALLTQSGTNAPVATVLENTLGGTVVWSRSSTGKYLGTLTGAFTEDKTISFFQSGSSNSGYAYTYSSYKDSNDSVRLYAMSSGNYADQIIAGQIEIRVYL